MFSDVKLTKDDLVLFQELNRDTLVKDFITSYETSDLSMWKLEKTKNSLTVYKEQAHQKQPDQDIRIQTASYLPSLLVEDKAIDPTRR